MGLRRKVHLGNFEKTTGSVGTGAPTERRFEGHTAKEEQTLLEAVIHIVHANADDLLRVADGGGQGDAGGLDGLGGVLLAAHLMCAANMV
jgi:hypothetical protein